MVVQLVLEILDALRDLLGLVHIAPEILRGTLGLEQVQLLGGGLQTQGLAEIGEDRLQIVQLYLIFIIFNGCHIQIVPFKA